MATLWQWLDARKALLRRRPLRPHDVVLLDTVMGSENSGDHIIMDACNAVCGEVFGNRITAHLATHYYAPEIEGVADALKILCGTNMLYTHMATQQQWALPHDLHSYQNTILLGVGMSDINIDDPIDSYSKSLYRALLSSSAYHSVRDDVARQRLEEIGFTNVLNTSCPTLWELTPDRQRQIPARKERTVLTSITDYCFSPEYDREMLGILRQEYERVVLWVQGSHDVDWCLEKIVNMNDYEVIGPGIEDLNAFVRQEQFDYVGTRLHAGIRCLMNGHRSLVVVIDNRARAIAKDTQLPSVERGEVKNGVLEDWINHPVPTRLTLPVEQIQLWKAQFSTDGGRR